MNAGAITTDLDDEGDASVAFDQLSFFSSEPDYSGRSVSKPLQFSNVYGDSAETMQAILALHFPEGSIIDMNFGLGVFYRKGGRERVTGIDLKPTGDVIADNRKLPFAEDSFDLAVIDPPYKRGDGDKYEERYGVAPKTETQVTRSYFDAMKEALRVAKSGVIIKAQDGTDGHRFFARHIHIAQWMKQETGLDPHDLCINVRFRLASTMAQGEPHFFQNGVSYWMVYKWATKNPYRPIRF